MKCKKSLYININKNKKSIIFFFFFFFFFFFLKKKKRDKKKTLPSDPHREQLDPSAPYEAKGAQRQIQIDASPFGTLCLNIEVRVTS